MSERKNAKLFQIHIYWLIFLVDLTKLGVLFFGYVKNELQLPPYHVGLSMNFPELYNIWGQILTTEKVHPI